mgnify:CR=1 FL=1
MKYLVNFENIAQAAANVLFLQLLDFIDEILTFDNVIVKRFKISRKLC